MILGNRPKCSERKPQNVSAVFCRIPPPKVWEKGQVSRAAFTLQALSFNSDWSEISDRICLMVHIHNYEYLTVIWAHLPFKTAYMLTLIMFFAWVICKTEKNVFKAPHGTKADQTDKRNEWHFALECFKQSGFSSAPMLFGRTAGVSIFCILPTVAWIDSRE